MPASLRWEIKTTEYVGSIYCKEELFVQRKLHLVKSFFNLVRMFTLMKDNVTTRVVLYVVYFDAESDKLHLRL